MKKSEILEKIYDYLNCDGVLEYSYHPKQIDFCEAHLRDMSFEILDLIEKAGMLPPKTELDNEMDKEACILGGNSDFTTADELRWEDEDEELDKET